MRKIYTSIDVGTDSIKILVGELHQGKLRVLGSSSTRTKGLKNGLIVDPSEVLIGLRKSIGDIQGKLGISIHKTLLSIPPYSVEYQEVIGYSTITNEEKKVKGDDIVRALQASIYNKVIEGKELVSLLPVSFSVDNKHGIKDPKEVIGEKLTVHAIMATMPKKTVHAMVNLVESLGLKVMDISIHPISDYFEFKNKEFDKGISSIINIGHETITVSVFENGIIKASEVICLGGKNIENDIAYVYKTSSEDSRMLKERFAIANIQFAMASETYELFTANKKEVHINQRELSEVVMCRVLEMLKLAKKQANLLTNKQIDYIILTGGSSEMPGLTSIVSEVFGNKARIATMDTIGIRENSFSIVSGLIKYYYGKMNLRGKDYSMLSNEEVEELLSSHDSVDGNHSVLSKIFGYFFDN